MTMKRFIISSRFLRGAHINLRECPRTGEKRLFPKSHKLKKEMLTNPAIFGRTNIQLNVDCGSSLRLRICVFHCGKKNIVFEDSIFFSKSIIHHETKKEITPRSLEYHFEAIFRCSTNSQIAAEEIIFAKQIKEFTHFGRRNDFRSNLCIFRKANIHSNEGSKRYLLLSKRL